MEKILKNEKHQGPLVNHTSFRFSCNIGEIEKNLLEYERYLSQIENSFDTSKEMQVRKKIAGRFSTEIAYKILTKVEFKTNHDNSFITALVPNQLALSERQIATLSEQLEAVYGINGYYVTAAGDEDVKPERVGGAKGVREKGKSKVVSTAILEKQYSKIKEPDIISSNKDIGILDIGKELDATNKNTVWHQIRKGLRKELGEHIDQAWFAKAEAKECRNTGLLTLTMPTRFMADWVRNNYSHVIRRLSEGYGIKRVEYGYA
uniref:Chromosomal replication initiator protein DnaA-like protein n=1 Tax=Rickettsia felis TaxID=42862 RepID=D4N335_RICFI|nr:chromosomal replication initiator protein DnaA-like protein [Rickettsia felis]